MDKIYNPLCLQKGEDLYVRYYETPEPTHPKAPKGFDYMVNTASRKEAWLNTAKEVKVRKPYDSFCWMLYNSFENEFTDYEIWKLKLKTGIPIESICDRIEIVNGEAILKPQESMKQCFKFPETTYSDSKQVFTREDMIGFAEWIKDNAFEHDTREQRSHTTEQLLDIYIQNK